MEYGDGAWVKVLSTVVLYATEVGNMCGWKKESFH
jgi:hypothetical protein